MTTGITDVEWLDKTVVEQGRLLGVCEYQRDKFKAALEKIAAYEISDSLNYYNARSMIETARKTLKE